MAAPGKGDASRRSVPPQRIGKYTVVQRLGAGGMGEVYLARAPGPEGIDKLLALKRILPHLAMTDDHVRQFLREARISATLQHPNIVQVFEVGQTESGYFFAMEYVRGVDLGKLAGRASLADIVGVVIAVAAALHHAHEQVDATGRSLGIVHRDVSPSNVLVSTEGAIKLTDFGIAKALFDESVDTRTGELKGKVSYMSPEQCLGSTIDRRSDIFSLGIVLYELTTGTRLFDEKSKYISMARIVNGDVSPPHERLPDYPPELEAIVMQALCKNPEERFQTAQAMQLALEAFARDTRLVVSSVSLATLVRELAPAAAAHVTSESTASLEPAQAGSDTTTTAAVPIVSARRRRHFVGALVAGASIGAGLLWWTAWRAAEPLTLDAAAPVVELEASNAETPVRAPMRAAPSASSSARPNARVTPMPHRVPVEPVASAAASVSAKAPTPKPPPPPKKEPWNLDSMLPP